MTMTATPLGGTMWRVTGADGAAFDVALRPGANTAEAAVAAVAEMLAPPPEVQAAAALAARRAAMTCSRLQGRLALGAAVCAQIDAIAADPATSWAMREAIQNAGEWQRTSEMITQLGAVLGYSDEAMDALFTAARAIRV